MKLTKRKGFNFFRSYYDVFNELNDDDKLVFIKALLDRQFIGEKPKNLSGMAKFAYISQTNSIDSQVKGYEDKTKTRLDGSKYVKGGISPLTPPPTDGGNIPPTLQEKEKEKEKVEYTIADFLENWSNARMVYLKKPTHIKKLSSFELTNFNSMVEDYTIDEIKSAIHGLFRQNGILDTCKVKPTHFLENVDKYLTAQKSNSFNLYEKNNKPKTEL